VPRSSRIKVETKVSGWTGHIRQFYRIYPARPNISGSRPDMSVTPPSRNDGVNQDHVEGFLAKREFTSTCIQTNNNSVLNIKIITI
jgi:hypothetical protein